MTYEQENYTGLVLKDKRVHLTEFEECTFTDCTFDGVIFDHCRFMDCTFINCNIVNIKNLYTELRYTFFKGCTLIGIDWLSFQGEGLIIEPFSKIVDCTIKYSSFLKMDLKRFSFSGSQLLSCSFMECDLLGSSFMNCDLDGTTYSSCDLREADFTGAFGYNISISNNKLNGARFQSPEVLRLLSPLGIKIVP